MHRIFIPRKAIREDRADVVGAEARKVRSVLRLATGDELLATDGIGCDYLLKIERMTKDVVSCNVLATIKPQCPETRNEIVLMQCCLSSSKMDQVIDKATQLGASKFMPVTSEKSKFRGDDSHFKKKVERWARIARTGALQSGRGIFPPVEAIMPLTNAIQIPSECDKRLLFSPSDEARAACDILPELLSSLEPDESVYLLIGPESGLSDAERTAAMKHDFIPVRMGRRTLRAETAPMVALALVLHYLGEL